MKRYRDSNKIRKRVKRRKMVSREMRKGELLFDESDDPTTDVGVIRRDTTRPRVSTVRAKSRVSRDLEGGGRFEIRFVNANAKKSETK